MVPINVGIHACSSEAKCSRCSACALIESCTAWHHALATVALFWHDSDVTIKCQLHPTSSPKLRDIIMQKYQPVTQTHSNGGASSNPAKLSSSCLLSYVHWSAARGVFQMPRFDSTSTKSCSSMQDNDKNRRRPGASTRTKCAAISRTATMFGTQNSNACTLFASSRLSDCTPAQLT